MALTSKQRAFLRKKAHKLDPIVRIGKDGFTVNIITSVVDAIDSRELIKVKILQNSEVNKTEVAEELARKSNCELVGVIGKVIILYKVNHDKPVIF